VDELEELLPDVDVPLELVLDGADDVDDEGVEDDDEGVVEDDEELAGMSLLGVEVSVAELLRVLLLLQPASPNATATTADVTITFRFFALI
jgi:hypothetical protein